MRIITGKFKNREILAPEGLSTRPTSARLREALFNICQMYIEDADFLDLFAGSGAMGIEAISRGASNSTFVDEDAICVRLIEKNVANLGIQDQARVCQRDVFEQLKQMNRQFDIIYADPPYDREWNGIPYSDEVIRLVVEGKLLKEGGVLFIEDSSSYQPNLSDISGLILKRSKKFGRSTLHQLQ